MKKLYTVLIVELVLVLIFEVLVGYIFIKSSFTDLINTMKGNMPQIIKEVEWVSPAEAEERREKALADFREHARLKKLGLVEDEFISEDLGFVPGTYQWRMQQEAEEKEEHVKSLVEELNSLREYHDTTLGSVEDKFGDMNYDLSGDAYSTWQMYYTDLLSSISYEVYDNDVFYIYTYLPGKEPNPNQIRSLDTSVIEDEKDVIEGLTGTRPERLTILYLSSDGEVLYELTN